MKYTMRVTVLALCLGFATAGRLRAPPVTKGAVHDEDKAVAKSTSKAISKHEQLAKEVVHKNGTTPAANVVGLPAAKQVVHKNGTNWTWAWSGLLAQKNVTTPVAKEATYKNGTNPTALVQKNVTKPVAKEAMHKNGTNPTALAQKNATKPVAKEATHKNGTNPTAAVTALVQKNVTTPVAKEATHKNGTNPAAKKVALAQKSVTTPVAAEATRKNGTNPAAKKVALLVHKNATKPWESWGNPADKPIVKETAQKNGTKPAEKEAVLLSHRNATNSPASDSAPKIGMKPAVKDIAHKNASKSMIKKNLTDEEQISSLQSGLNILAKLKPVFTAPDSSSNGPHADLEKFAQGALSTELASKDSPVWAAIQSMLSVTTETAANMTGKSKSEQEKAMDGLRKILNVKALVLGKVTQKANAIQTQRDDEYLLGVLMQHQKDWSMEQQLNVTKKFADNCEAAKKLLKNYNKSEPLAPQFAALMDQKNVTAAVKNVTKKAPTVVKVVTEKTAAKMFLQLVSSFDRVQDTAKHVTKAPTAAKVAKEKAAVKVFLQVVSSFHRVQA